MIDLQSDLTAPIRDLQFRPDGSRLATLNADGYVDIREISTLSLMQRIDTGAKFGNVHGLAFNADGSRLLVTGSADKLTRQYAADGSMLHFLVCDGVLNAEQIEGENTIIFSPDGKYYVFGGPDGAIIYSDIQTGRMSLPFGVRGLAVQSLLYSPDGKLLVSTHPDFSMRVWDTQTHKALATLNGHRAAIKAVAFSRDSKLLASAGADKTIRLWNMQTGESLGVLYGDLGTIYGLSFNADDTILASGGSDKRVTLWEVQTTKPILTLNSDQDEVGDQGVIGAVAFSPDGALLAVAGENGTVRLWGVRQGTPELICLRHSD